MDDRLSPTVPATDDDPAPGRGASIGRFVVLGGLGGGGMGVVLSAYDPHLDRKVALKLLRRDVLAAAGLGAPREALFREAQVMARLSHPNIVPVHEVGEVDGAAYLVMEQIDGQTLRAWSEEPGRTLSELLEVLRGAGAGLAAAHRAGVVHRDVKPDNVLVGSDGRPRISDFGLSALARAAEPGIGTRGYMAPEQAARGGGDVRSDQYSFCVMAWEALHGVLPAPGTLPPGQRRVPSWVDAALARGLHASPAERWSSMDALLHALAPRAPKAGLAALGAAALAVAVAAWAFGRHGAAPIDLCGGAEAEMAPLWTDATRAGVARAFEATGRGNARDAFRRVDAALRGRLDRWAAAHREACEATRVRHAQSDTMLDQRMRCLGDARKDIASLIDQLGRVDAAAVDRAIGAAAEAGDLASCSDVAYLAGVAPPPSDAATARAVEELRLDIARWWAIGILGKWKEAGAMGPAIVARARALGHPPLLARAVYQHGVILVSGDDIDGGIAALYEAVRLAATAHDDVLQALALSELMFAVGSRKQRFEVAEALYAVAIATAAHAGYPSRVVRNIYNYRHHVLEKQGKDAAAMPYILAAYAMAAVDKGPRAASAGMALAYVAGTIRRSGRVREALPIYQRALEILEAALGPEHPHVSAQLGNYAAALMQLHEWEAAAETFTRIIATEEVTLGPDARALAHPLRHLASVRGEQRRLAEGVALAERARAIALAKVGPVHGETADADIVLGDLALLDARPEDAHARYQAALGVYVEVFGATHDKVGWALEPDARALLALGRVAEARATIDRLMAIEEKNGNLDHPDHGLALDTLARVELAERKAAGALAHARRALALVEPEQGPHSPALVDPLIVLCRAQAATGDVAAARTTAARAARLAVRSPADVREEVRACAGELALRGR